MRGAAIQVRPALGATVTLYHAKCESLTVDAMSAIDEKSCPALADGRADAEADATTGEPITAFSGGRDAPEFTAQEVVERCDGKATVEAIIFAALAEEYDEKRYANALRCAGVPGGVAAEEIGGV